MAAKPFSAFSHRPPQPPRTWVIDLPTPQPAQLLTSNALLLFATGTSTRNPCYPPLGLGIHRRSHTTTVPVPTAKTLFLDSESVADRIAFLRTACFAPTTSKAIEEGYFTTWPGLTSSLVRKHLPKSVATGKGRLDQHRANVRATKTQHNDAII
jgi:hypothetical protein